MDAAAREAIKKAKGAEEDVPTSDEVLASMASVLVDNNTQVFNVEELPDRSPPKFLASKKPPKEVFYRKTQLFSQAIPAEVGPKRCTCVYLCHGAPAVIKCSSCQIYDPKNLGLFCQLCFDARHPWYRVPHVYESVESDESVAHTLKVSHRRAEMKRFTAEYEAEYKSLIENKPKLDYIEDDVRVVSRLREVGSRTMALEKSMRDFRKSLRQDILSKPLEGDKEEYKLPLSDDEAACIVQQYYRGWKIRDLLSRFLVKRLVRGIDKDTYREFYYDKVAKKSVWKKPVLLKDSHVSLLKTQVVAKGSSTKTSTKVPSGTRDGDEKKEAK